MSAPAATLPARSGPRWPRAAAVAALFLGAVVLAGLVVPWLGYDPVADVDPRRSGLPPSAAHLLGTDHLGRDIAWRLLLACRAFVGPGLLACAVALALGVPAGAFSGYLGGPVAAAVRYLFSVLAALPRFVLVLLVASIYGHALPVLAVAAGVSFVPILGESVHARIEELRNADYITANRAHGLPGWRILWVHLVWAACRRRIARHLVAVFGYFLVLETTLSYIGGFGVREPMPSWGNMLVFAWGRAGDNPLNVVAPAAALWLTVLACAVLSRALGEEPDA